MALRAVLRILVCLTLMAATQLGSAQPTSVPQTPITPSSPCRKNISFAVAEGGQPVPAVPKFASKWVGKSKHVEGYPQLCLSQIPSSRTANYVVVFSTTEASFDGLTPIAHTYVSTGASSGNPSALSSYGGTWNYSYMGAPPADTTSTIALQKVDSAKKSLVIRAYNQQGHQLAHYNGSEGQSREQMLDRVFGDINRDQAEVPIQKKFAAPMSVYYVNCDVDSDVPVSQMASADPSRPVGPASAPGSPPAPAPKPAPVPTVSFASTPPGADIYVDGNYVGKTPFTASFAPGDHDIVLRKQDFGEWERKIQLTPGPRKVTAYLERRFLTIAPSQPAAKQP